MKVENPQLRAWFQLALKRPEARRHSNSVQRVVELKRQLALTEQRLDEALNMRLSGDLEEARFERKRIELEEQRNKLQVLIDSNRQADSDESANAVHAGDALRVIGQRWVVPIIRSNVHLGDDFQWLCSHRPSPCPEQQRDTVRTTFRLSVDCQQNTGKMQLLSRCFAGSLRLGSYGSIRLRGAGPCQQP